MLTYLDGSTKPWAKRIAIAEAFGAVEHFLTRQARWYKDKPANSQPPNEGSTF